MDLLNQNWGLLAPELTIVILATVITIADLVMRGRGERKAFAWLSVIGIIIAVYFTTKQFGEPQYIVNHTYQVDSFAALFKIIFLVGTGIVFIMSLNYIDKKEIKHDGELYYLLLTALLGAMMMASSANIITLYIGLELLSVSSYIMTGIRKDNLKSNEAAYKYVITGGVSSAIFLFGTSYIFGLTGTTNLVEMQRGVEAALASGYDFYVYLGFFLMFVGLTYKISIVPSYMWAPDVYEGAPTPVTAFLSVISKAAGFAMIIRIFLTVFKDFYIDNITMYIAVLSAITMIVGNTLALRQTNVKRIFALSSVAQAGYIVIPMATITSLAGIDQNISNIIYYLFAYLLMNLGAFTIITIVNKDANTEDIKSFAGLYHRAPKLGIAMTFFLLSLAGLPVTAGFIGKFYIFINALDSQYIWLALIMVVTSVISYFYYFNIIRQMYMRPGHTEAKLKVPFSLQFVVLIAFLGVLLIGLFPNSVLDFIIQNFNAGHFWSAGIEQVLK